MQHDWIKSTLGHGDLMCRRCCVTNLEAAALGITDHCDAQPPKSANENAPAEREWSQDEIDEQMFCDDEDDDEAECGRWNGGHLTSQCRLAGSEWCDWDCPLSR